MKAHKIDLEAHILWKYYYISTVYTEWMDFNGMTKKALGKNMTCTINRFIDYKTKTKM